MGRKINNPQSKWKYKSAEKNVSEIEASNLSDIEFKKMVIRMLKEPSDNFKELSGNYNGMKKEIETSSLSDIEFKKMVIRMLKELSDNYKELSGNYNSLKKEIETMN